MSENAQDRGEKPQDPGSQPVDLHTDRPHPARVYDYLLGGKDNYAADRAAAHEGMKANPNSRVPPRENRSFMPRAVGYLVREAGISQFLDIGTGIPTSPNVHEIAQQANPRARIVYVDNDRCKSGCMHGCTDGRSTVGTGPSETVGHSATRALVSP
jgi:hypothetical protein